MGLHQEAADVRRAALKLAARELARAQLFKRVVARGVVLAVGTDHIHVVLRTRHLSEIVLTLRLAALVYVSPPVSHYHTVKAPLAAENCRTKVVAARCPKPVYRAVGGHNGGCSAVLYCNLKALQINLAEGALGGYRVYNMSACFLIVAAEVLYRAGYARAVKSL